MIPAINQFIKSVKMRYCDALKFSIVPFSDKVLSEPTSESEQSNSKNKPICSLDTPQVGPLPVHNHNSFGPVMIIIELITAGPKPILNGSAITEMYGDVILRDNFKNLKNLMK
jgi:hypothetical protein